jgi:hypothetical protein
VTGIKGQSRARQISILLIILSITLGVRGNSRNKEAVLVAHGITRDPQQQCHRAVLQGG